MKKYLFLSSALVMTMAGAHAADKIITSANTCTVDVLGVSDNNATANTIATWSLNSYECVAGQYLDETTLNCTECPTGSYCPGGVFTVEANNSKTACPADYTSDAATTAESECYMDCELACIQNTCPENSHNCTYGTTISTGKQYYGQNTCDTIPQFCSIDFECEAGYTKITISAEEIANRDIFKPDDPETPDVLEEDLVGMFACSWDGRGIQGNSYPWTEYSSICQVLKPGQVLFFRTDMKAFLYELIKNEQDGTDLPMTNCDKHKQCISYNQNFVHEESGNNLWIRQVALMIPSADTEILNGISNGSINIPNDLTEQEQIEFVLNMVSTESSAKIMNNPELLNNWTLLLIASYKSIPFNNIWIKSPMSAEEFDFVDDVGFTPFWTSSSSIAEAYGEITYCKNNKININWNPDNGETGLQGMCFYDQGIAIPSDPVKPGYTFTGWKLVE